MYMYVYTHMYMFMYKCIYVCMYIFTEREIELYSDSYI